MVSRWPYEVFTTTMIRRRESFRISILQMEDSVGQVGPVPAAGGLESVPAAGLSGKVSVGSSALTEVYF